MAIQYIDKKYGTNSSTAITDSAANRNKVQNRINAAGIAFDSVSNTFKANGNDAIVELADLTTAQTFTNKTLTTPVVSGLDSTSTGVVVSKGVAFSEQAGTTLTGTVPIPAGAWLLEIQFVVTVLAGGTSASLIIGDDDDDNGWLTATDLKATDLLVGEVFSILNSGATDTNSASWVQGTQGAYLTQAGRKGNTEAGVNSGVYYGASNNVIATITQGTPSTTGRYHMVVYYTIPDAIAAVVA